LNDVLTKKYFHFYVTSQPKNKRHSKSCQSKVFLEIEFEET
jgi:hypothetical protein